MLIDDLLKLNEWDYLDFKREWPKHKGELLKDILCMCNSRSERPERYIVIGVTDKKEIIGVPDEEPNFRNTEKLIDFARANINSCPDISVEEFSVNGLRIHVIKITPDRRHLPYRPLKNLDNPAKSTIAVNAGFIYGRDGATNTPSNRNVSEQYMWDLEQLQKSTHPIKKIIYDIEGWTKASGGDIYYKPNDKCRIKTGEEELSTNFNRLENYHQLLVDTYLDEKVWEDKKQCMHSSSYEHFCSVTAKLKNGETTVQEYILIRVLISHYPEMSDGANIYYLPALLENFQGVDKNNVRESLMQTEAYQICRILYKYAHPDMNVNGSNDRILDFLNYEYLADPSKYLDENSDYVYKTIR